MRTPLLVLSLAAALTAGCSPYDPDLGDTPFRCGADDAPCPDGYTCMQRDDSVRVCVREGQDPPAGAPDAGGGLAADAGALVCNDDSPIEPNENIGQATLTPIPDTDSRYRLPAIAVCPGDDIDVFRLRVDDANQNIRASLINTNRTRGELVLEILNAQGVMVATADYESNTNATATLPNAPQGIYFVRVRATNGDENNYGIEIETSE